MPKTQSAEYAVKLAVLRNPEAFGLRQEDVNPLLQFVMLGTERDIPQECLEDVIRQCQFDCAKAVNAKVAEVLSGQAGAIRKSPVVPDSSDEDEPQILDFDYEEEPEDDADSEPEPEPQKAPVGVASTKRNGKPAASAAKPSQGKPRSRTGPNTYGEPKVSVKQLRYIGYLQRQLDEEPDYKEIAELTLKQATMRIRELEKELASK